MKKRVLSALLALCMACTLAGNVWAAEETEPTPAPSAGVEAQTVEPQTVEPTLSAEPTQAPAPSPDATAEPEATPVPSAAPSAAPDPTVEPDVTPAPTEAPEATDAPAATATPDPTGEPAATATPAPTEAPAATEAPAPSEAPSATPAPTAEAEGERVADGVEYTAALEQDGQALNVIVTAPEGAFDAGVTPALSVTAIEDEAEGDAIAAKLDESGVTYDGFAALDISFKNEAGEEIEPKLPVTVRIELPEAIVDSGIDLNTLAVQHLAEDEAGNVTAVEQVASVADGTIALSEEAVAAMEAAAQAAEESNEAAIAPMMLAAPANDALTPDADTAEAPAVAEFEVSGFSTFTITWEKNEYNDYFEVTVHYVNQDGEGINGTQNRDVTVEFDWGEDSAEYTFADYAGDIDGYSYTGAHYQSYTGDVVTRMVASSSSSLFGTTRKLTFYNGTAWNSEVEEITYRNNKVSRAVYLVYEKTQNADLYIENSVTEDGRFTAVLNAETGGADVTYTWYRSVTGADNTWEEVAPQRVTGTQDNLTEDGSAVNVAYDSIAASAQDDERYWYYVTATVGDTVYTSEPLQVPYYIELQNGSFETPVADHWNKQVANGTEGLIWQTTGEGTGVDSSGNSREGHDIEIVRSTDEQFWDGNTRKTYQKKVEEIYSPSGADDGVQFAELNCEAYGALYQDVMTIPGDTLNWYLSHCAREGQDQMALVIMPVDQAENLTAELENATSSDAIRTILQRYERRGAYVKYMNDDTKEWERYNGEYEVPDGQYVTRFFFVAVSTGSGNNTVGNLLDRVGFGHDIPEPENDEGYLTVTKVVSGVTPPENYSVEVDISGDVTNTYTYDNFRWDSTLRAYTASHTFRIEDMQPNSTSKVTVTETVNNAPTGYTETSKVAVGDGAQSDGTTVSDVEVKAGATQSVTFTNAYASSVEPEPIEPQHRKYIDYDGSTGTYDLTLDVKGKVETNEQKLPVDVLMIVDTSGSMVDDNSPRMGNAKAAMKTLVNTLEKDQTVDAKYSIVCFDSVTDRTDGRGSSEDAKLVKGWSTGSEILNVIDTNFGSFNGTNYEAGLDKGAEQLLPENGARVDATQIVLFLSDGVPSYANNQKYSANGFNFYSDAWKQTTEAAAGITCDRFYSIGIGESADEYLNLEKGIAHYVNAPVKDYQSSNSTGSNLTTIFEDLAGSITSIDCSNVAITDTLSEYAKLTENATFTVRVDRGGNETALTSNPISIADASNGQSGTLRYWQDGEQKTINYTVKYNATEKTFTLTFDSEYKLENDWTYSITTQIEPTEKAYIDYQTNKNAGGNGYGAILGDDETDADGKHTSSGMPGFYSNKEAKLTYTSDGEDKELEYPDPVIQVSLASFKVKKVVADNVNTGDTKFTFEVKKIEENSVETVDSVTIGNGETAEITNLLPGIYKVVENTDNIQDIGEDYYFDSVSYSVGEQQTNSITLEAGDADEVVTITNTYKPYRTVTITKNVMGPMGDTTEAFDFTTSVTRGNTNAVNIISAETHVNGEKVTSELEQNKNLEEANQAKFTTRGYTLANGESITISKLKDGDELAINEPNATTKGYKVTWSTNADNGNVTVSDGDMEITVTNTRNVVTPTGLESNHTKPYALMVGAGALAGLALVGGILARRARRRREW